MMFSDTSQMVQVLVVAWCWLLAVGRGSGISGRTMLSAESGNVTVIDNKVHTTSSPLPVFTTRTDSIPLTQIQHHKTTVPSLPWSIISAVLLSSHKDFESHRKQQPGYVELTNPVIGAVDSEDELSTMGTDTSSTTEAPSTLSASSLDEPDPWDSDVDLRVTSSTENSTDIINVDYSNVQNQSFTTETNLIENTENTVLEPPKTNTSVHVTPTSQSKIKKHKKRISKSYVRIKHIDIPSRHIITSVPQTFISNYKTTASTLLKRIMADPPYKFKNRSSFKSDILLHRDRSEHSRFGNTHIGKSHSDILPSLTSVVTENKEYRKHSPNKRISIGIPASSRVSTRFLGLTTPTVSSAVSTSKGTLMGGAVPDSDEYYSSYVEYPDLTSANAYNNTGYGEAGILPDPDLSGEEEIITETDPEPILPDDSLADTDLHDHDLIDSVMYIYFGAAERDEKMAGRQVLIVGAVIALVAQFLTLTGVLRRIKTRPDHSSNMILLNSEISLTVANLIFMLGVQATGNHRHCEFIAVTLHYLHLVTCCLFFINCFHLYMQLKQPEHRTRIRLYCLLAWISPLLFVLLCLAVNRRGYEIGSYCWLSMKRGILFSFAIPVTLLILLNMVFATLGFRVASQCKSVTDEDDSHRKSLRIAVTLLPVFSAVWILGVVALESSASLVFPLLFVVGNGFLNWFVFACWLPPDLSMCRESDDDFDEEDDDLYDETPALLKIQAHNQRMTAHDSQPLLDDASVYVCGRRDVCELQMDPICTISS